MNTIASLIVAALITGGCSFPGTYPYKKSGSQNKDPNNVNARIFNGKDAKRHEFPFMVYLNVGCGGTLITPTHVLTAAHCVFGMKSEEVYVVLGAHEHPSTEPNRGIRSEISEIQIHEDFSHKTAVNDVAVLRLKDKASIIPGIVETACLASDSSYQTEDILTVAGWGMIFDDQFPEVLQKTQVPIIDDAPCKYEAQKYRFIFDPETMICVADLETPSGACNADSGGPLFKPSNIIATIVGLVSYGSGCKSPGKTGAETYTKIPAFLQWIQSKTGPVCIDI